MNRAIGATRSFTLVSQLQIAHDPQHMPSTPVYLLPLTQESLELSPWASYPQPDMKARHIQ